MMAIRLTFRAATPRDYWRAIDRYVEARENIEDNDPASRLVAEEAYRQLVEIADVRQVPHAKMMEDLK